MQLPTKKNLGPRLILIPIWLGAILLPWRWVTDRSEVEFVGALLLLDYCLLWIPYLMRSRHHLRGRLARVLLVSASLVGLLVILEGLMLVRVVDYRELTNTPVWEPWRDPRNLLDDELLHVRRPYLHVQGWSQGGDISKTLGAEPDRRYEWDFTYDRHGFRNAGPLGPVGVALIGDSIVEAMMLPVDDIFSTVLAQRLGVTVANLGQYWYGPQQELVVLERFALPLEPRACLWVFFEGNDLDDIQRYREATEDWGAFSQTLHGPIDRSFTKNFLGLLRRQVGRVRVNPNAHKRSGLFREADGNVARAYFGYISEEYSEQDRDSLVELQKIFERAAAACAAKGTEFYVAIIPIKYRVIRDFCDFEPDAVCADWPLTDLPELLRAMVTGLPQEVPFLDLTPALRSVAETGVIPFLLDDTHLNEAGHEAVAVALADFLGRQE